MQVVADRIVPLVVALTVAQPRVAVAIDGPDCAGKSTFADTLARDLGTSLSPGPPGSVETGLVRVSIDDFHRPRAERRRRGDVSPDGYLHDAFDLDALARDLLQPFRDRAPLVRTRGFDLDADVPTSDPPVAVPPRAVLVMDGVFLLRPELRDWWDLAVYLHVPPEVSLDRALRRDVGRLGTSEQVRSRYLRRYLPAQARYRRLADPLAAADVALEMTDPVRPVVLATR